MPEPRDPQQMPGEESLDTLPMQGVQVERTEQGVEIASDIEQVLNAVAAHTIQLAEQGVLFRDQLISRRLYGDGGKAVEFERIIQRKCELLGIGVDDYEAARLLATVPDNEVPDALLEAKQNIRTRIIDPIDEQVALMSSFRGYFPDQRTHMGDVYDNSYRYAVARERLESKTNEGRNGLTGLISDQGYLSDAFDLELEKLAMLDDFEAMLVIRVDVSNFKLINDRYSHAEGDRVLKELADVFSTVFKRPFDITGSNGMAGQPGGDEFVFIVNGIKTQSIVDTQDLPELSTDRKPGSYKQPVIAALVKRLVDAAATVKRPDGSPIQLKVGIARIHQADARSMLYSKGDRNRISFDEYQRRADEAAIWAGEIGDSEAAEWTPNMPEIELTPDRALAKMQKALSRTLGPVADDLASAGRLMRDDPEVMALVSEDPVKAMALYFSKMEKSRRESKGK